MTLQNGLAIAAVSKAFPPGNEWYINRSMNRRSFLRASACASVALAAGARTAFAADAMIDITAHEAGPQISPNLYGQFIEHLGGVIYDGIWVGRDSKISNIDGIRKQFLDDMKRIAVPNFRWPGGCFADGYHWRDGLGEPSKRPRTYNYWQATMPAGYDATETNQFGIHEFMHLCRLTGAEPYLAANMGSGSPPANSTTGCNTATHPSAPCRSLPNAPPTETKIPLACAGGVWAMSPGAVAET